MQGLTGGKPLAQSYGIPGGSLLLVLRNVDPHMQLGFRGNAVLEIRQAEQRDGFLARKNVFIMRLA